MSVFTNPASAAKEHAAAYVRAVLDLVAGEDPLRVLGETASFLEQATSDARRARLAVPEAPGKWSVLEVIQHLADSELVFGYRIRRVLAEDRPAITGFDQDLWADRLRYAEADVQEGLELFRAMRAANLRLLRGASAADLQRAGVHAERGEETLSHMVRLYAGHDQLHRRQIERILGQVPV